jgi:hypothetical protein
MTWKNAPSVALGYRTGLDWLVAVSARISIATMMTAIGFARSACPMTSASHPNKGKRQ